MSRSDTRRRRRFSFVMKVAAVLLGVVIAVYLLLLSDLQRVRKWRLDQLRAAGIPASWSEVVPPLVPDDENAAIPYQQAFEHLQFDRADKGQLQQFLDDDPPGARGELWAEAQQILARNQAALDLIGQAVQRPSCRFPIEWDNPPAEVLFPHFSSLRTCARLVAAETLVAIKGNDVQRAIESFRSGLRISAHTACDPTLLAVFSSIAIQRTTLANLPELIEHADLNPDTCRAVFRDLGGLDYMTSFRRGLAGDGAMGLWLFEAIDREPGKFEDALGGTAPVDDIIEKAAWRVYVSPLGKTIRLKEEIAYTEHVAETITVADRPYRVGLTRLRALHDEVERAPSYHLITHLATPILVRAYASRDRAIADRNAAQVALALEAYHSKHGGYPDALDALQGYPGWKLPDDPFSGKPFVYRRQGQGFILYSWGEDLDDDGGRPAARGYREDGDMVWPFAK